MRNPTCTSLMILLVAGLSSGQTSLTPGATLVNSLTVEDRHDYQLEIAKNHFVVGHVDQRTVDVVITIRDGAGATIGTFDGPGTWNRTISICGC